MIVYESDNNIVDNIHYAIAESIRIAKLTNSEVKFTFNGIPIIVDKSTEPHQALSEWHKTSEEKSREALKSFDHQKYLILSSSPPEISYKNKGKWESIVVNNQDKLGLELLLFTDNWGRMMEGIVKKNEAKILKIEVRTNKRSKMGDNMWLELHLITLIENNAEKMYKLAGHEYYLTTHGSSGYFLSSAVSILSEVWEYGDELLVWYNKYTNN